MLFTVKVEHTASGSGGSGTGIDLSTLIYAYDDAEAGAKGVPIKGYFLAAAVNGMGKKYGDVTRREY